MLRRAFGTSRLTARYSTMHSERIYERSPDDVAMDRNSTILGWKMQ